MASNIMIHNGKYGLIDLKDYEKNKDIFDKEGWGPVIIDSPEHHKFKEDQLKWDNHGKIQTIIKLGDKYE